MTRKTQVTIPLPRIPGFLIGTILALVIVGAFMATDRSYGHWYTQNPGQAETLQHDLDEVKAMMADLADVEEYIPACDRYREDAMRDGEISGDERVELIMLGCASR